MFLTKAYTAGLNQFLTKVRLKSWWIQGLEGPMMLHS
uniref:Uncharacterized protein n=1 Tax=Rhizophora mucronata TaxID=61149 RepID=A0A2P2PMZ4_RHIMU